MGALSDKAKQQSNWLILDKGTSVVVRYCGFRFIPNRGDPSKDDVQYKVNLDGKDKYWTNGSGIVMRTLDKIKEGSYIRIYRKKWLSKDGVEDPGKSSYVVEECDELGNPLHKVESVNPGGVKEW